MRKQHWYAYAFQGSDVDSGAPAIASTYMGYPDAGHITLFRIREARKASGIQEDGVLLSVSYLGHMTRDQMTGDES